MVRQTYLWINVYALKFMGMYEIDPKTKRFRKFLIFLWRTIVVSALFSIFVQSLTEIFTSKWTKFTDFSENFLNACIYLCSSTRVAYFIFYSNNVKKLVDRMNREFAPTTYSDLMEVNMTKYNKLALIMSWFWLINVLFCSEINIILPLFYLNKTGKILPLKVWYPWDWKQYYTYTIIIQFITNIFMGYSYGSPDTFYVSVAFLTARQFKILATNFKTFLYQALLEYGVSRDIVKDFMDTGNESKVIHIIRSEGFKPILSSKFNQCIEQHKKLLSYCQDLEEFFSPNLLPNLLFGISYLILIAFTIMTAVNSTLTFSMIEYFLTALYSLYLMNYFGDYLTEETENLKFSLYECPWYLCCEDFKTTFKFVHLRLTKPVVLSAGKFVDMSLETYLSILKTAFSYCAVLRQVTERQI